MEKTNIITLRNLKMEKENKTLKDFRRPKDEESPYTGEWAMGVNETCDKLKQEAIKHIKFNEEAKEKNEKLPNRMAEHYTALNEGAIIWIKWFFNVSEEDLK